MRRISIFTDQNQALAFSLLLKEKQIESQVEASNGEYFIWVVEEDAVPKALEELDKFKQNPGSYNHKKWKNTEHPPLKPADTPDKGELDELRPGRTMREELVRLRVQSLGARMKSACTRFFIGLCALIYLIDSFQGIDLMRRTSPSVLLPLFTPIEEHLIYELPQAVLWNDELIREYQYADEKELSALPPKGQELVKNIQEHPPWGGFYQEILAKLHQRAPPEHTLFEQIREGEVWRLVTPIFLHANILHILFNMLWLWMLGRIIEARIGAVRYIAMVIIVAVISNTLQYLVSGPLFMGFSGVVCGLMGFIWMRQIIAPLEVYPVHKGAIFFLWIFILGMFVLQFLAFFLQVFNIVTLNLQIANTAHLSGALLGILLARIPFFHRKNV